MVERDQALANAAPKRRDPGPERRTLARAEQHLQAVRDELAKIPDVETVAKRANEAMAKIAEAEQHNDALDKKREALRAQLGVQRGAAKRAKAALDALLAQPADTGHCPLCESKLAKVKLGQLQARLRNQYESGEREAQRTEGDLSALPDRLSVRQLEEELETLASTDTRRASLAEREAAAVTALATATRELEEAERTAETPGDPEASALAGKLAGRIAEGNRRIELLLTYLGARRAHEAAVTKKAAAEERWTRLNALVDLLGPGGLRKAVGGGGVAKFHEDLNALLAPLGYAVDLRPPLDLEDDPLVTYRGVTVPARMLSRSGAIRFSAAFAVAAATYSGLGIVVVDDFEALEPANRAAVWQLLHASGHQVFVLVVQTEPSYAATAATRNGQGSDVRWFHVAGGEIALPQAEAANGEAA